MNILLLGAAGFIGTNLILSLVKNVDNTITAVDINRTYFSDVEEFHLPNVHIVESEFTLETDFDSMLSGQDVVYHLISTTVPTTSNKQIATELTANVVLSAHILDACVQDKVKKVIFLSSGGTVYGKEEKCPLNERTPTNPISSYGVQKITIEKLLYLYGYMYGLDYRIIRLSNPYGPYQRPNGVLGAVTTFTYKALRDEQIQVYGDGSVVRDFIYIDDAIRGIRNIVNQKSEHHVYNLGSGYGTSIREVLEKVRKALGKDINVQYTPSRSVDVPVNYLDISRYEREFGRLNPISLEEGIQKTAEHMRKKYGI